LVLRNDNLRNSKVKIVNKPTKTLLPIVRVAYYCNSKRVEKYFAMDSINDVPSLAIPFAKADAWLKSAGRDRTHANIYLIDKVNGEWRSDYEAHADGCEILPHPWATTMKDSTKTTQLA
jgi:hypothetical protein